ncbi:enolase C-terminal domain-like protein [Pseudorhodoplanes sp.]|uniref:enolase C-terminal domain-like protein n=1 Tax=Pseudorhodoplanes sp. TaxID=1934341 RepID=UPI003D121CE0
MTVSSHKVGVLRYAPAVQWEGAHAEQTAVFVVLADAYGARGASVTWADSRSSKGLALTIAAWLDEFSSRLDPDQHPEGAAPLINRMRRLGTSFLAVAAIDNALWDLRGQRAGKSVHALLGSHHQSLPAQGASRRELGLASAESIAELMHDAKAEGLLAFKLHLWGDPARDMAGVRALRTAMGPDYGLVLDPMGRYRLEDAVTVGRCLTELGFLWFEDPISAEDHASYPALTSRIAIPLAGADALLWSWNDYAAAIARNAPQILRLDPGRHGISFCHSLAQLAEAKGLRAEFHSFGPEPSSIAALHCAVAQKATSYYEVCHPQADFAVPGIRTPSTLSKAGSVSAPSGHGLGLEIDWAALEKRAEWIIAVN